MKYKNIREEELKNKVSVDWFKKYKDSKKINIEDNYNLDIKNLNI